MCVGSRVECREAQDVVCACVYAEDRAMRGCGREGVVLVVRLHGTTFFFFGRGGNTRTGTWCFGDWILRLMIMVDRFGIDRSPG